MGLSTYTRVNNTNFDPGSRDILRPELFHLGHHVGGEGVYSLSLPYGGDGIGRAARPDNLGIGPGVRLHGPYGLDTLHAGKIRGLLGRSRGIVEDDRRSLKERVVQVHPGRGIAVDLLGKLVVVLGNSSSA